MEKRNVTSHILIVLSFFVLASLKAQNIEVKAYKVRLSSVIEDIAKQSKKKVTLTTDQNPLISFGSKETSLADTLKKIENLYGFQFEIKGDEIHDMIAVDIRIERQVQSIRDSQHERLASLPQDFGRCDICSISCIAGLNQTACIGRLSQYPAM